MSIFSHLFKAIIVTGFGAALVGCSVPNINLDANDPDVNTYLGANYKTTIPQEFKYILYSRHGTFDASLRFTNTGTLVFGEEGLSYANNSGEITIDYDDIVSVKRLTVPVPRGLSAQRRDTWLAIRFQDGDKVRRVGFRGDLARSHRLTGDRLVGLLRNTLAERKVTSAN
ncbi:MAG: hypothetical protein COB94_009390 [Gammaproteobacteria bacterium]|nr:hypothetical protein [Gammaproteobacteria bacterium]